MGQGLGAELTGRAAGLLGFARALGERAALVLATVAGAAFLILALLTLAPGDAIDLLPNASELRPVLEREWHLDRPFLVRYLLMLRDVAGGDLGTSIAYRPGLPVREVVVAPALRSLSWLGSALVLALAWGTALAWLTAGRRSVGRHAVQAVSIVPVFLLAHVAVRGLNDAAVWLMQRDLIDRPSWFALPVEDAPLRTALAIVLLAVGSGALAEVHAEVENALVRIRGSGFVDAARARGAPVWPHVARNLVPPLTTVATTRAAHFVGGLVILEKVLLLNGVGFILWEAALQRDHPLAVGITVGTAAFVALVRLAGDAVRLAIDPRLRQREAR